MVKRSRLKRGSKVRKSRLKDWKKIDETKNRIVYRNITKKTENALIIKSWEEKQWDVLLMVSTKVPLKKMKTTKTKKEALTFAKKYMRSY